MDRVATNKERTAVVADGTVIRHTEETSRDVTSVEASAAVEPPDARGKEDEEAVAGQHTIEPTTVVSRTTIETGVQHEMSPSAEVGGADELLEALTPPEVPQRNEEARGAAMDMTVTQKSPKTPMNTRTRRLRPATTSTEMPRPLTRSVRRRLEEAAMTLEDEPTRRLTATQWLDEYNHDQVLTPTAVKEVNDGSARDMPSAYSLVTDSSSDTRAASNESGDLAVAPGTNRSALEQEEATDGVPDTAAVVPLGLPRGTTSPVVTLESAARAKKNVAVEISRGVACNQQQRASEEPPGSTVG
ncbi:hypothetical protein GN244_ATG13287 [Phytophthora infestans]|uniref:Uncharacterized protein n=1 Tax=Phytophthora infestans TaxID=4787 RepID=A0A833SY43_PHYIN|nr:hypothetical protein GN244_ATG13287 [Phytophthora infestans]